jgi:thiamine kinase-like enzyme
MKTFIKNVIKKYTQKAGIQIQYLPEPKHFYHSLQNRSDPVKHYEVKRITNYAGSVGNHKYYEGLLKAFVPNWQVDVKEAKFIGKGFGESGLNTYRMVSVGNKAYFEKVYFNSHNSLQAVQWFQKHIYKLIKEQINVPLIQKTYEGEAFTIVYYSYLKHTKLEEEAKESSLIQFSKDLYRISDKNESYLTQLEPPDVIKDFRNHSAYRKRKRFYSADTKLAKQGIDIESAEELIARSKRVLTHGDINKKNSFKNDVLIDWDSFGFSPIGLDPAFIYYHIRLKKEQEADINNWLKEHYRDVVSEKDWNEFERNFMYFLYIFSIKRFAKGQVEHKEQGLNNLIKSYF